MDWKWEVLMSARVLVAAVLGGAIGWDRMHKGHDAGIRTYAAVSLGACAFGLVSAHVAGTYDVTRIAAQVVTGIGFLGGGVILHERGRTRGLTTAATLWAVAAVGLAIGYGLYVMGTLCTLIMLGLLKAQHLPGWPDNGKEKVDQIVPVMRYRQRPERFAVLRKQNAQRRETRHQR
jgi:putative Mg2+ transporter-C (MgtC) family protein